MYEVDTRTITGIKIILNKEFLTNTIKPHYYLNKITRKLEVDSIEVSEDVYDYLKNNYQKSVGYSPRVRQEVEE